jgi:hypothetical protein
MQLSKPISLVRSTEQVKGIRLEMADCQLKLHLSWTYALWICESQSSSTV